MLTDGLPNRVPTPVPGGRQEDTVLAEAALLHEAGIEVHTVGYGREDAEDLADRILPWLLEEIAGDPSRYTQTDDASRLADGFPAHRAAAGLHLGGGLALVDAEWGGGGDYQGPSSPPPPSPPSMR